MTYLSHLVYFTWLQLMAPGHYGRHGRHAVSRVMMEVGHVTGHVITLCLHLEEITVLEKITKRKAVHRYHVQVR